MFLSQDNYSILGPLSVEEKVQGYHTAIHTDGHSGRSRAYLLRVLSTVSAFWTNSILLGNLYIEHRDPTERTNAYFESKVALTDRPRSGSDNQNSAVEPKTRPSSISYPLILLRCSHYVTYFRFVRPVP